jgi:hypothetical protein
LNTAQVGLKLLDAADTYIYIIYIYLCVLGNPWKGSLLFESFSTGRNIY